VPDKNSTSVCAGPLYAPGSSQDIPRLEISLWTVRTSPRGVRVPSQGNTEIPIRCVGVRRSLTGVRILVAPEVAPVGGGGVRRGLPRLLTIVRGTPVPGYRQCQYTF
jgi:hypothetical protein